MTNRQRGQIALFGVGSLIALTLGFSGVPGGDIPTNLPGNTRFVYLLICSIVDMVLLVIYFVPSIVASERKKRNTSAIIALNLFLGWTLVGWVVALVWALTLDTVSVVTTA